MSVITPIIGHEKAQAQLVRLVRQQKLPHAILFTGPRGIGKAALADTLARCLLTDAYYPSHGEGSERAQRDTGEGAANSQDPPPKSEISTPPIGRGMLSYNPSHPAITRLEAGGHGNFKAVEPLRDEKKKMSFTTITIDQIREVVEFMHLSTSEKGWRIVLIDPADGMNRNAENALLKVLEEPPKQTLLMLVTHQPNQLLPTTRSRCREIKLTPPTQEQVEAILAQQQVTVSDTQRQWLSALVPPSAGSWKRYLEADAIHFYEQWLTLLSKAETAEILSATAKLAKLDTEQWQIAGDLYLAALHRLVLASAEPLALLPQEQQVFPPLQATASPEHWQESWQAAAEWLPLTTASNYDKKQVLQSLLFQAVNTPKKAA